MTATTRRPRILARLALVAGSLLVTLLVLEIGFRVMGVEWTDPLVRGGNARLLMGGPDRLACVPDSILGWTLPPSAEGRFQAGNHVMPLRTNRLGIVGPEPPFRGRPRVLVLGDSYLFGWGVTEDTGFAARLQQRLRDRVQGAKVVNAAVPGFGLGQQAAQGARVLPEVEPDLVIVSLSLSNDGADEVRYARFLKHPARTYSATARDPYSLRSRVVRRSRVLSWVDDRTLSLQLNVMGAGTHARALMRSRLETLSAQVGKGRPIMLLVLPRQAEVRPSGLRGRLAPRFTRGARALAEEALREGLVTQVVDVTEALRRADAKASAYLDGDSHWSEAGHVAVADTVAAVLLEHGWVGGGR